MPLFQITLEIYIYKEFTHVISMAGFVIGLLAITNTLRLQ